MRVFLKIVSIAVLLFLPLGVRAVPAKPTVPYRLVLSVGKIGLPELTVTLVNLGPAAVKFFDTDNPSLVVEYKAAGSPSSPTGWQRLKSNAELCRKPGKSADTDFHDVLITVAPKQKYSTSLWLSSFPAAVDGYYRITAEAGIPVAGKLTLRSNSLIIRRTAGGFVAVSPV